MLDPDDRSIYTDALTPPAGMVFEKGIAATYSLDISTLMTIPIQLCLAGTGRQKELLADGITLLDSLRRTVSNLCVFCERGRIAVPGEKHFLYSMLEQVIVEALAPAGGAFHPKFWLLKYIDPKDSTDSVYRLMILSRNITQDRSWDVATTIDGRRIDSSVESNAKLMRFLKAFPGMAVGSASERTSKIVEELSSELEYVEWKLPDGFYDIRFHVPGTADGNWMPEDSASMVVVSPFLADETLRQLAQTTREPLALVSRSEEMALVSPEVLALFKKNLVLHEAAEQEEGEEVEATEIGLHAKLYIFKEWHNTHVVLGSANATVPALLNGSNIELLVELIGKSSSVGRPEDFLSSEAGIGEVIVDFDPEMYPAGSDENGLDERRKIDYLRKFLVKSGLSISCMDLEGSYRMELVSDRSIAVHEGIEVRVWPITVDQQKAYLFNGLNEGEKFILPEVDVASITGFIAFELKLQDICERFVLNLPITGVPEERESAILKTVIENREGFIRYLRMLLSGIHDAGTDIAGGLFGSGWFRRATGSEDALLEHLVLALSRDPGKLNTISNLIEELRQDEKCEDIFPEGFLEMWSVFENVMAEMNDQD